MNVQDLNGSSLSVVMIGATGAVGNNTLKSLLKNSSITRLTLLGRRKISNIPLDFVQQEKIDILNTDSYNEFLFGHDIAICTLGIGQPSKVSKKEFIKIDKTAVIEFAEACKKAGVKHFQLLASIGSNSTSSSFYLRTKGELIDELIALDFDRLSIFRPSMILTPKNRYGFLQGLVLFIWPILNPLFQGKLRKYRGVKVDVLGKAIASNLKIRKTGLEYLDWDEIQLVAQS